MSILGRTGGDSGSSSNKAFSDGFAWANLDIPAPGAEQAASRRAQAEESSNVCGYHVGAKLVSKIYMTVGVLVTVALTRALVKGLYVWKYPTDRDPKDLAFPGWEVSLSNVRVPLRLDLRMT